MKVEDLTLLVVEDDPSARECIKKILDDTVKEVYLAADMEDGWRVFEQQRPHVVLTDLKLPNGNGIDLIERIKKSDETVPVLVFSAYDTRSNILNCINRGVEAFLPKPVDIDLLTRQLDKIVQRLHRRKEEKNRSQQLIQKLYKLAHYDH